MQPSIAIKAYHEVSFLIWNLNTRNRVNLIFSDGFLDVSRRRFSFFRGSHFAKSWQSHRKVWEKVGKHKSLFKSNSRESFRLALEINCSFVNNYWATVYCDFSQPVRLLCVRPAECLATSFFFSSFARRTIALRCDILPLLFVYNRNLLKRAAQWEIDKRLRIAVEGEVISNWERC